MQTQTKGFKMEHEEKLLIPLLLQRNEGAFEQIFKKYFKSLHSYAYTILKNMDDAEDLVQNVFYKLWHNAENYNIEGSIGAYLYRAVHNESLNALKHEKVKTNYKQFTIHAMKNEVETASKKLNHADLEQKLRAALNELPEQCRTIFQMSRFDELKYIEIANKMGLSVKTIENQMGKALRILRLKLVDFLPFLFFILFNY